ncbi:hypothetical protein [Anaeromyxobacter diazotrophicus]|uniref:Uncharacterized protein n=1 Tax=Anaeromyxobacter diazotrophicus TaxID=2590199 RepID=A0A7I9VGG6_9BACT|nr:hypothetical protein [Anaeromyxobacter diazotrophicus]GEJ55483.1 hypothetical protein AMYX_02240 [Anaeromyxobacter diazotrophicus]
MPHRSWSPAASRDAAPEQRPPAPASVHPDGSVDRELWAPSEGPCRHEVGGAGGEPEGRSLPIRKVCWD